MKPHLTTLIRPWMLCLLGGIAMFAPPRASAQWGSPNDQRNALNGLRTQLNFFQNATRTASNYGEQGYGNMWGQFQSLRGTYSEFRRTLSPHQLERGGNAMAELDAGLDIIQEAFTIYQNDIAAGRNGNAALRDMCQVLREGTQVWAQELKRVCSQLRVGMG